MASNGDMWAKLLATPGARSDDPEFNPKREPSGGIDWDAITKSMPPFFQSESEWVGKRVFEQEMMLTHLKPRQVGKRSFNLSKPPDMRIKDDLEGFGRKVAERMATSSTAAAPLGDVITTDDLYAALKKFGGDSTIKGLAADMIIFDELTEIKEPEEMKIADIKVKDMKPQLEALATELTNTFESFSEAERTVSINSPMMLTVMTAKGWSKANHIGGEEFVPTSAYVGKKNTVIVVFKPIEVTTYIHMEMPIEQARQNLSRFDAILENCGEGGYQSRMTAIKEEAYAEVKQKELAKQADAYAGLGFGSW